MGQSLYVTVIGRKRVSRSTSERSAQFELCGVAFALIRREAHLAIREPNFLAVIPKLGAAPIQVSAEIPVLPCPFAIHIPSCATSFDRARRGHLKLYQGTCQRFALHELHKFCLVIDLCIIGRKDRSRQQCKRECAKSQHGSNPP